MRVLFLCTGNSARSQLAEALLRERCGARVRVASAGTDPRAVHPLTVEVLAEAGIDASDAVSKRLDRFLDEQWDWVITVCDRAAESCPTFPGAGRRQHWSLPDPAAAAGDPAERRAAFRRVRDAIAGHIEAFVGASGTDNESGTMTSGG